MEAPLAKGTPVRQVVKPITGMVADIKFNADSLSFEYLVGFIGDDGAVHERWFDSKDVESARSAA